jgi:hypothetical protein
MSQELLTHSLAGFYLLAQAGKHVTAYSPSKEFIPMAELFKPTYQDHATGKKKTSRYWYARIRGKRIPLKVTDRRIAER